MHAWDTETWSVVSTETVAVVALTVTGLSGWRDRVHARHLAREERRQDRIERTYAEVLTYLSRAPALAQRTAGVGSDPGMARQEIETLEGLVRMHASDEVAKLFREFSGHLDGMLASLIEARMNRGSGAPGEHARTLEAASKHRAALLDIEGQIEQRIRRELGTNRKR